MSERSSLSGLDWRAGARGAASWPHSAPEFDGATGRLRGRDAADPPRAGISSPDRPNRHAAVAYASLPAGVRDHLGAHLRTAYDALTRAQTPQRLLALLAQLDAAMEVQSRARASVFRAGLTEALPGLRAFALSLIADSSRVDDLVQETVLRAWASQDRFLAGTNLKAWLCTILRNQFYTECRKRKREIEDADGIYAGQLTAMPDQEGVVALSKLYAVLETLPARQREALLMVGAEGYTYEQAADLLKCQVGTVKSRVSRARGSLVELLGTEEGVLAD